MPLGGSALSAQRSPGHRATRLLRQLREHSVLDQPTRADEFTHRYAGVVECLRDDAGPVDRGLQQCSEGFVRLCPS